LYVVVETDPGTNESHVLFPRGSMVQVHATLETAERHRSWYIDHVYVEDSEMGQQTVRIFRLKPVELELPFLRELRFLGKNQRIPSDIAPQQGASP
jgi:hypothetical protein